MKYGEKKTEKYKHDDTYIDFSVDDIDKTAEYDYKIEHIPRIAEVILSNTHATFT